MEGELRVDLAGVVTGHDNASSVSTSISYDISLYVTSVSLLRHLVSYVIPLVLLLVSSRLWTEYICQSKSSNSSFPLPPGSMGLPFIGETLHLVAKGTAFFNSRRQQYGNIFKTHLLGRPTIRIIGAQNVRRILLGEHTLVTTQWPTSTQIIFGDGALALSSGAIHKERRKAILRAFNQSSMQSYVQPMQEVVRKYLRRWCDSGDVHAYPACKELTFNIAATMLVGCDIPQKETLELLHIFQEMTSNVFSTPIMLPGTGLYKAVRARETILARLEDCLQRCPETLDASTDRFTNVLRVLKEAATEEGEPPSRRELLEAALELLFAGHETTASAACATMLHLAKKPEVVEKICKELNEHGLLVENDGNDLTYDVIGRLTYTNLVVREILRISPPIGGAFRRALKTFEIGGYQIPEGWTLVYSIRDTHQTSAAFDDVDEFNPDRWLTPPADGSAHQDFLPFGSGPRACVGKEFAKLLLKVVTIELVRNCSWFLVKGKTTIAQLPVPHPKDDMPIRIREVADFRRRTYTV